MNTSKHPLSEGEGAAAPTGTQMQSEAALIVAMRSGDVQAVGRFVTRFRPILEAYARKAKIPEVDWPVCVAELLEDEALRLSSSDVEPPVNLAAYLIRAAYHRYMRIIRTTTSRERIHFSASEDHLGVRIVASAHSQDSLRVSAGPDAGTESMSVALKRLAAELGESLTSEESAIMVWVSESVPHGEIARWLGISHQACTKRIWRLCNRLRSLAATRVAQFSRPERLEVERFMRRAGEGEPASRRARSDALTAPTFRATHGPEPERRPRLASGA